MWLKVDDSLIDHPKMHLAGELLAGQGEHLAEVGRMRAFTIYMAGLSWVNHHLTDGHIPRSVIGTFTIDPNPTAVAQVLASEEVGLWNVVNGGYLIHDYHDHNPQADEVKAKLKKDRDRKREERRRPRASMLSSSECPNGQTADASSCPDVVHADSTALARARSGSGSGSPLKSSAFGAHALHRANDPESHVASHWLLVKLVHDILEAEPGLVDDVGEIADRLKWACAQHGLLITADGWAASGEVYKAIESALAQQHLAPAKRSA